MKKFLLFLAISLLSSPLSHAQCPKKDRDGTHMLKSSSKKGVVILISGRSLVVKKGDQITSTFLLPQVPKRAWYRHCIVYLALESHGLWVVNYCHDKGPVILKKLFSGIEVVDFEVDGETIYPKTEDGYLCKIIGNQPFNKVKVQKKDTDTPKPLVYKKDFIQSSELIWGSTAQTLKKGETLLEFNGIILSPAIKMGLTNNVELTTRWHTSLVLLGVFGMVMSDGPDAHNDDDTFYMASIFIGAGLLPLGIAIKHRFFHKKAISLSYKISPILSEIIATHQTHNQSFTFSIGTWFLSYFGNHLPSLFRFGYVRKFSNNVEVIFESFGQLSVEDLNRGYFIKNSIGLRLAFSPSGYVDIAACRLDEISRPRDTNYYGMLSLGFSY